MKISKKLFFPLLAFAVFFVFSACNSSSQKLPKSVGENPFAGKTFKISDIRTATFTDKTVEFVISNSDGSTAVSNYRYAYDTDKELLYSISAKEYNKKEAERMFKKEGIYLDGHGAKGVELEYGIKVDEDILNQMYVQKYSVSGENLELHDYFLGTLPTSNWFHFHEFYDLNDRKGCYFELGIGYNLYMETYNEERTKFYTVQTKFNDGKFSSTLYKKAPKKEEPWYEFLKLGTIKGTYETHGTGTSGCTVTLKITEIPKNSTISEVLELNKEYTLKQQ